MEQHELDFKALVSETIESIQASIDFAYPGKSLDHSRTHGVLQAVQGKLAILRKVVKNINVKPDVK